MKIYTRRLLAIIMSIMTVMLYMVPGSVFAEGKAASGDIYQLVDTIDEGEYLIVSGKTPGSLKALQNPGGTSSGASIGTATVTVENIDSVPSIADPEDNTIWKAEANGSGVVLKNGSDYLEGKSGNVRIFSSQQYPERYWTYSSSTLKFNNSYSVYCSNDSFTASMNSSEEVYIYKKVEAGAADVTGVSLDKDRLTLKPGGTASLKATVSPTDAANKTVSWSTDNADVATVESGTITAVGKGTATITATTEDGGFTASCHVTVKETAFDKYVLTDMPEDGKEYLIASKDTAGDAYVLANPGGTPDGAVMESTPVTILEEAGNTVERFISVDTEDTNVVWVVTSDSGGFSLSNGTDYLEGKSGKVSIFNTVQYADRGWEYTANQLKHVGGQNSYVVYYDNGFTSTYNETDGKVYFFEKHTAEESSDPVPVESITLDKEEASVETGKTITLKATVLPENADDRSVTWTSADPAVATVNASGTVTGKSAGTTQIEASSGGLTAQCVITVTEKTQSGSAVNIGITSDVHGNSSGLESWLQAVQNDYEPDLDSMLYCGDYSYQMNNLSSFISEFKQIVQVTNNVVGEGKGIYTSGNHEYYIGNQEIPLDEEFTNTPGFVRQGEALVKDNYIVYCMGAASWGNNAVGDYPQSDIDAMAEYLDNAPSDIPILIPAHFPLHYVSGRTVHNADKMIEVLNEHPNAIFFWGHNHSQRDPHYGQIVKAGDTIEYAQGQSSEINFTYACAGGMYQDSQTNYSGAVLSISSDGSEVTFQYYRAQTGAPIGDSTTVYIEGSQTEKHTITASAGPNGSISPSGDVQTAAGKDRTFEFTPDAGHEIDKVTVDGEEVTVENNSYTFHDVASDHTIYVTFKEADVTEFVLTDSVKNNKSYLIVSNGRALLNDNGVISQISVQISDNGSSAYVNTSDTLKNILWTLHDSNTSQTSGDYTIENNGYMLSRVSQGSDNPSEITEEEKFSETSGLPYFQWSYDAENELLTNLGGQNGDTPFYFLFNTSEGKFYTSTTEGNTGLYVPAKPFQDIEWSDPEYEWADDNSECTASRTGSDGSFEEETKAALITDEPATCETPGKKIYTGTFENKAFKTQTKEESAYAFGHDWDTDNIIWTWTPAEAGGYTATAEFTCRNDESHKQTLDAVVTSETTEPTFEESGRTIYSAFVTFGGNVYSTGEEDSKTTVLPPIGYEWADPEYEWADDNSSVTATRRSTNAPDHQITETVDTMIRVTQPATCEEDGTMLYIADFENAVFETQTKEAVMPVTGHKYNYTEFEWTEGLSAATAVFTCENDSTHIIKVNAVITPIVTPPTCTLTGTRMCIADVYALLSPDGKRHTTWESIEIPATGHSYESQSWTWAPDYSSAQLTMRCPVCGDLKSVNGSVISHLTEPTCTTEGKHTHTARAVFEGSEYIYTKEISIPETGHSGAAPVKENMIPATCEKDGSYDEVVYCSTCGEEVSREAKTIERLGHDWGRWNVTKEATCTKDGSKEKVCADCGDKVTEAIKSPGHQWETEYTVDKKATYAAKGSKSIHCSVCDEKKPNSTVSIPKLKVTVPDLSKPIAAEKGFTAKWKKVSAATGYQIQYALNSKFTKSKKTVKITKAATTSKKITKLEAKKKYYVRIRAYKTVGEKTYYSEWGKSKTVTTK